ncbi:MAG: cytochrome PufQ [Rhodobacteraceae bacterium]|nr:cytochrome PufQ [Paracoccaceae bacterium]MCY4196447.1 cytochrome PufQ [Paracoccaceae bacterium]MCY4327607.1 cytochrome PufQ [Paracoccaceae bacterium]
MLEMTMNSEKSIAERGRSMEYYIYFTLIFLLALPINTMRWIGHIVRARSMKVRGPVGRAWAEAHRFTPCIFSA